MLDRRAPTSANPHLSSTGTADPLPSTTASRRGSRRWAGSVNRARSPARQASRGCGPRGSTCPCHRSARARWYGDSDRSEVENAQECRLHVHQSALLTPLHASRRNDCQSTSGVSRCARAVKGCASERSVLAAPGSFPTEGWPGSGDGSLVRS